MQRYVEVVHLKKGYPFPGKLRKRYFITTELGVFYVASGVCRLLTPRPGYGLAIANDKVYFSYEDRRWDKGQFRLLSKVISANTSELLHGNLSTNSALKKADVLFIQPFYSNNGRIHQITFTKVREELLIAASEENSIVKIDLQSNKTSKIYPFSDCFGVPIKNFDHNHINSAIRIGDVIYFVAYKAGDSSLIGYLQEGEVFGWLVNPKGYHDFYPTDTGFITCDTFGNAEHGRVLTEAGCLLPEYFEEKDFAVRGIAGDDQELLIGHSHKGPRSKRFKGKGGLIIIQRHHDAKYFQLPAAQVYQIIREDGGYISQPETCSHNAMKNLLDSQFGPARRIGRYGEEVAT